MKRREDILSSPLKDDEQLKRSVIEVFEKEAQQWCKDVPAEFGRKSERNPDGTWREQYRRVVGGELFYRKVRGPEFTKDETKKRHPVRARFMAEEVWDGKPWQAKLADYYYDKLEDRWTMHTQDAREWEKRD